MFKHIFYPPDVVAIRLVIVLIQAAAAALVLGTMIAVRRWLLGPIVQRLRDRARARRDGIRQWRAIGVGQD
jgi:hypothetical protein